MQQETQLFFLWPYSNSVKPINQKTFIENNSFKYSENIIMTVFSLIQILCADNVPNKSVLKGDHSSDLASLY